MRRTYMNVPMPAKTATPNVLHDHKLEAIVTCQRIALIIRKGEGIVDIENMKQT
jgi:hypothetical protein